MNSPVYSPIPSTIQLLDAAENGEVGNNRTASYDMVHPKKVSIVWRILHSILCIGAGIAFLLGSYQYFPRVDHYAWGGALFTLGSAIFSCADLIDWWTNYDSGLFNPYIFYDAQQLPILGEELKYAANFSEWFKQHEILLNCTLSTIGSLCYLAGCILFIPSLDHILVGDILFIPGSVVIAVAESWRIYRAGCVQHRAGYDVLTPDRSFRWENLYHGDLLCLGGDVCMLLGVLTFLAGCILFLPDLDRTDIVTYNAALTFVIGSALFILSECFFFYKYVIIRGDRDT